MAKLYSLYKAPLAETDEDHMSVGGTPPLPLLNNPGTRWIDILASENEVYGYLEEWHDGLDGLLVFLELPIDKGVKILALRRYLADLALLEEENRLPTLYGGQREKYERFLLQLEED